MGKEAMPDEETGKQTTKGGQTDSQPAKLTFDPKAMYEDPDSPGEFIKGDVLKAKINRGVLFDKAQSERDKARSDLGKLQKQIENMQEEMGQYKTQAQEREAQAQMLERFKAMGLVKDTKPAEAGNGSFDWLTEPEEKPGLTQEQALQMFDEMSKRTQQSDKTHIYKAIDEYMAKDTEQKQRSERYDSALRLSEDNIRDRLAVQFPDVHEAERTDLAKLITQQEAFTAAFLAASEQKKDTEAQEAYTAATALQAQQLDKLMVLASKQQEAEKQKEKATMIEMLNRGGYDPNVDAYKPTHNKREAASKAEENLKKARDQVKARERVLGH